MPGVAVVVSVTGLFIADIDPIAGIKKLTDAAPTSTGFPAASEKTIVRFCFPLRTTPSALDTVTVRLLPAGPLFMVLPVSGLVPELAPELQAADHTTTAIIEVKAIYLIALFIVNSPFFGLIALFSLSARKYRLREQNAGDRKAVS